MKRVGPLFYSHSDCITSKDVFNFAIIFVVFDIEPRRARTRRLKTTKKSPAEVSTGVNLILPARGQSRVTEGGNHARLFHG